jgi:hypothetical protein
MKLLRKKVRTDVLIRYEDFWMQNSFHGLFYEIPTKLSNEYIGLSVKLFNSFTPIPIDIPNETDFDILYNKDCNGFKGFNFSATNIPANRHITDLISFNLFKLNCANQTAYNSIQSFWDNKELLFPKLVFCERVWNQIEHLSVNDDRFGLINEKLKMNTFTGNWKEASLIIKI